MHHEFLRLESSDDSESGFTLVELTVAMGLIGILCAVAMAFSVNVSKSSQRSLMSANRDQLVGTIRNLSGNLNAIWFSLRQQPENAAFKSCVCGGGAACTNLQANPFYLYTPTGQLQSPGYPSYAYFDASGLPCAASSTSCFIQVSTAFLIQCMPAQFPSVNPLPAGSCAGPGQVEFVEINYSVQQNPLTVSQGIFLKPAQGSVFLKMTDLVPPGSTVCQ